MMLLKNKSDTVKAMFGFADLDLRPGGLQNIAAIYLSYTNLPA